MAISAHGPLAVLTLQRPDTHHALSADMLAALDGALHSAMANAGVRVVLLRAEGPTFCAGADLRAMRAVGPDHAHAHAQAEAHALARVLAALRNGPKPVIARVQGHAFGGGVGLLAACDLAFATAACRFALSEVRLGLIPAVISPYVLARIGPGSTRRLCLSGDRIDAAQAHAMGLLDAVCDDAAALDARIDNAIASLLQAGPEALAASKTLLAALTPIGEATETMTCRLIAERRHAAEGQEGMAAFLDKRPPAWAVPWTGRHTP